MALLVLSYVALTLNFIRHIFFSICTLYFTLIFSSGFKLIRFISNRIATGVLWTLENILGYKPEEDSRLSCEEIIQKYGYPVEAHHVTTEDGYILTLYRIPHGRPTPNSQVDRPRPSSGQPVLLQHGLTASSTSWLLVPPEDALPFLLADQGYDVWLSNCRGNEHALKHVQLRPNDHEFWEFSFHQMALYDIPRVVDHVLEVTGSETLDYIGHSMGTTVFFIATSLRPEYNDKIRKMVALTPAAFLGNARNPASSLKCLPDSVMIAALKYLPIDDISHFHRSILSLICQRNRWGQKLVVNWFSFTAGVDLRNSNMKTISKALTHLFFATAPRVYVHFSQLMRTGLFAQYDHGREENERQYRQKTPPSYDLSRVTCPVFGLYSTGDVLCVPSDVRKTLGQLGNCVNLETAQVHSSEFQHTDFLFADKVKEVVYDRILSFLNDTVNSLDGID